ncbi:hypothetical protein [Cesiribacter andamanensis]|uniref:Uncharacterized protein n=1 Tax=Cesiribacter andamanensis AMV16 TaxID=1279009 RepID=M7N5K9_9BACT|nr:hypothetical protein [Cesiribacter andamanensis]EMR03913.1 hypothetical protein ADICEAN_00970 [Cesiribacter andamanensis AMV16]
MKTLILPLLFSALFFAPSASDASQDSCCTDSLKTTKASLMVATELEEEAAPDLEAPFWFQEKVYIHIYDQNDQPLVDGAFTSKELKENKKLRDLLRKSTRFLSLDTHHYYMLNEE